ncbi:hypothetical protein PIB30_093278, partial [Stylosanthes scabra]|nr:hypothetical protein [Stylosanthes scabra]
MRGRQAPFQLVQGHAHVLMQAYVWKTFKPSLSYEDPRIGVEVDDAANLFTIRNNPTSASDQ